MTQEGLEEICRAVNADRRQLEGRIAELEHLLALKRDEKGGHSGS